MKREELKALGLNDEQVEAIMKSHGTDVESLKKEVSAQKAQIENLNAEKETNAKTLKDTEDKLKELQSQGVNVEELQKQLETAKAEFAAKEKEMADKENARVFNEKIDGIIKAKGGLNATAIKSLMNLNELSESKNQDADITKAIEELASKEDSKMLFNSGEPVRNPVSSTTGNTGKQSESTLDLKSAIADYYKK